MSIIVISITLWQTRLAINTTKTKRLHDKLGQKCQLLSENTSCYSGSTNRSYIQFLGKDTKSYPACTQGLPLHLRLNPTDC